MKKNLLPVIVLLFSSAAFAQTDHYFLRDGNHVRHLKISQIKDKMTVTADVDFEPNPDEEDGYPCAAEISGEAKKVAEDVVVLKKTCRERGQLLRIIHPIDGYRRESGPI